MSTTNTPLPKGYSVSNQHDYITLRTPYGSYTTARFSERTSGRLAEVPGALDAITDYMHAHSKRADGTTSRAAALEDLAREFERVVPGVLSLRPVEAVAAGDTVAVANAQLRKRYPAEYRVGKVKGKYAYVELPTGLMGLPIEALTVTKKA